MDNIQSLYQEMILEHNKRPRNYKVLEGATHQIEGYNPLCGDHYWVYLRVNKENLVEEVSFQGEGCAISKASTSLMTETLKGKSIEQAQDVAEKFFELIKNEGKNLDLGKLQVFAGIWKFPARVKCALLSWRTAYSALKGSNDTVKTE